MSLGLRTVHPLDPLLPDLVLQDGSPAPEVPEPTPSGLSLRKLRFCYGSHRVIDIPALDLPRGQVTAVVGPNGAGKSTLTRILVGLERAHGTICLDGRVLRARERTGLDYRHLQSTAQAIRSLADQGRVVVVVTHDEELLAACADRIVELQPL